MSASDSTLELVIDSFAGGGGASEGIRAALGRDPDIAINHDRMALAMHRMNHPGTHHIAEDVVLLDPRRMVGQRPIGMLWMSPDCKDHSKAKGGKPLDKNIRGLAWTVVGWMKKLPKRQRARVVFFENVEEFADWVPLRDDGSRCPLQKGAIFRQFVAAFLAQHNTERDGGIKAGSDVREPVRTVTGSGGQQTVVSAFLAQHNTDMVGHDPSEPLSTIVGKGPTQGVVAAHMLNLRGSDRRDSGMDEPAPTVSAQGNHAAAVCAFLAKYYGAGEPVQAADEPLHTVTAKPRHGLVTVTIAGEPFVIVDIGMRMLTPRERFSAQGFRRDYVIDRGLEADGSVVPFTLEQQGRFCGNSVCPRMAEVLVAPNYKPRRAARRPEPTAAPLLTLEAAE